MAEGASDPAAIAALADGLLRATPEQFKDALGASEQLHGVYRRLLKMALEELQLLEHQIEQLDREAAGLMQAQQDAVRRVAEIPGMRTGFGAPDDCRNRRHGSGLRLGEKFVFVGGSSSWGQ